MDSKLYDSIPSLNLADFTSGDQNKKMAFVNALGEAYQNIGFVAIKNHGLTEEMTTKLYETVKQFFTLSDEVKKKYEKPEIFNQRGYISKGKEHAKGRTTGDLKEFYHIGQPDLDRKNHNFDDYPDNVWPSEIPAFEEIGTEVFTTLEKTGLQILKAIAIHLGLDENYFEERASKGNSILRPIHYYPIENPEDVPEDAVRAAEHGDINLITLLMGASADGLQVLRRDGAWIPITALPNQIVVNVGDMLDRLTNHKLKSTIHRVVNPPKEKMNTSRYSIPFFMHPKSEMDLTCLESCVDEENPKQYSDITAGKFLAERLAEIGLGSKK
ncbi:MAG: isopenicillin N synthase family oxygenase [Flammeovirgaceae bacterium]|nr:isopenicillin N synthase family oxygenase [Flammeovirgaceae bacterium]